MTLLLSPRPVESAMGSVGAEVFSLKDGMYPDSFSTRSPADPTMVFFNIDHGKVKKLKSNQDQMHHSFYHWKYLIEFKRLKNKYILKNVMKLF